MKQLKSLFPRKVLSCLSVLYVLASAPLISRAADAPPSSTVPTSFTLFSAAETDTLLSKIYQRMGATKSFDAAFIQEHHLAMFMDVLKARGMCYYQAPDRFRWELFTPYRSILAYNHDRVAKFEFRDGQMKYIESGAYDVIRGLMSQMTGWVHGDFKSDRENFDLAAYDGKREYLMVLAPRKKEMLQYIQRIEVYLKKEPIQTTRIVVREIEQDTIEINFSNVHENIEMNAELFNTKKPLEVAPPGDEKK